MRTIREAISTGTKEVFTNNGTSIFLPDIGQGDWGIAPPKTIQGKPVYRWIFCWIKSSRKTVFLDDLENRKMGKPFRNTDYCIPERELNLFIALNGGIDEYRTRYWVDQWDH